MAPEPSVARGLPHEAPLRRPPDPLSACAVVCAPGARLAALPTLPALLAPTRLVRAGSPRARQAQAALAWGRRPSAARVERWAAARGVPVLRLEDGFLRSVGLGADEPPWSVVVDDAGIYYDADAPSRLEALVRSPPDAPGLARAARLIAHWRDARASKYNQARELLPPGLPVHAGLVLVADQTLGDASLRGARAGPHSFRRMLEAALDEHPQAQVLLKVHPDVVAGRRRGCVGRLTPGVAARLTVVATDVHPPALLERAAAVYTVSSQLGFEGLLWGRPVRCFGLPFYAGWGLTRDELRAPARRGAARLEALVHAALVDYPRYLDPETRAPCEVERLLEWIALQRAARERFAPQVLAFGFSRWKKPLVRAFFAGSQVRFAGRGASVPAGAAVALWGGRAPPDGLPAAAPVVRLEDGFLRSVGLGADLVRPLSWVMDPVGMHYDASRPSAIEHLLQHADIDPALRARAGRLRERLLALGLSKYNTGGRAWRPPARGRRPIVLVVGQVEDDAAVALGRGALRTNIELLRAVRALRPDAWLLYKPHPDVVARLREPGCDEAGAAALADEVVADVAIDPLLRAVGEVHVLSSLAGFEALLRGTPVVAWGRPFYAGWGLTTDRADLPCRTRRRSIDELVAAALILYPTYLSRASGHFTTAERALEELHAWRLAQASRRPSWGQRLLRRLLAWGRRARARACRRAGT